MVERPYYLDRLKRLRGGGLAKILTGMRRAGKSGILRLLQQSLLEEGVDPSRIVFIDFELMENESLRDADALLMHLRRHASADDTTYVLLDEAQEVPRITEVTYSLVHDQSFDVYLTGSHSKLIEQDLSNVLAGHYVELPVFGLSFSEYRAAHLARRNDNVSDAQLFQRYLTNGGLPHSLFFEHEPLSLREYLDGVYHTVIRKDVATELGHEDPQLLDAIASKLMDGIGASSTANGISHELSAAGRSCSDDTVARYVRALTNAYAFYRVPRLDLRTGLSLKTQEKYYVGDLGLRTLLRGPQAPSLAGLLENVVYLELRRRYDRVNVGKHYARHISFVTQGTEGRSYFQIAPSVLDPSTLDRTLAPLRSERDNYPKTILTLDEIGLPSHDGIRQQNLVEWLLSAS